MTGVAVLTHTSDIRFRYPVHSRRVIEVASGSPRAHPTARPSGLCALRDLLGLSRFVLVSDLYRRQPQVPSAM